MRIHEWPDCRKAETTTPAREYQKPVFRRTSRTDFVTAEIKRIHGVNCRQCSSCHGCR